MSARVTASAAALVLVVSGCGVLKPFRVGASEKKPSPASAADDSVRKTALATAFGLARDDDFVVRVVADQHTCSGTLIAEDQVLTAHHCVAERTKQGEYVAKNVPVSRMRVELGGDYLPWGDVGVRAAVTPPCGHAAGDGDIAVLVLERKLIGVATAKPRLETPPEMGERIDPIGFGRCALSSDAIQRHQRSGGKVDKILETRFRLNAAICPGDSGGPALGASGEVVGVISAAAMDGSESTIDRAEFTRLDRWRGVFATAKAIADGASPSELPPVGGCHAK